MTTVTTSYIVLDDRGRPRVAGTGTKVILIVRDKLGGMTPEQIHEAYPALSLAQIHAALAYYYDHKMQIDAEIERQDQEVAQLRAEAEASGAQPTRADLERRLHEKHNRT